MAITPYKEKKYTQSDAVNQAQQALQNQQANKPGQYRSQFQTGMNEIMGQIQNRPKFQYDVNADALYQQVAQNYMQQGKTAMMDTMGQAAALTGGYGNSYAQTAGQQAYNQYLTGLTELVPQYQQLALQQYRMEGDQLLDQYNLMLQQEELAYGRYQDDLSRYYADLDRLQDAYNTERDYDYSRYADDRDFSYGRYMDDLNYQYQVGRDQVADDRWLEQLRYQQERDRIQDEQWQKEFDENQRRYDQEWAWQQAQAAAAAARSSGGGNSRRKSGDDPGDDAEAVNAANAAEAYRLYQRAISQQIGQEEAKNALKVAEYSDAEIDAALDLYQKNVVTPLRKPIKTKYGTM